MASSASSSAQTYDSPEIRQIPEGHELVFDLYDIRPYGLKERINIQNDIYAEIRRRERENDTKCTKPIQFKNDLDVTLEYEPIHCPDDTNKIIAYRIALSIYRVHAEVVYDENTYTYSIQMFRPTGEFGRFLTHASTLLPSMEHVRYSSFYDKIADYDHLLGYLHEGNLVWGHVFTYVVSSLTVERMHQLPKVTGVLKRMLDFDEEYDEERKMRIKNETKKKMEKEKDCILPISKKRLRTSSST